MEKRLFFQSGDLKLEGYLQLQSGGRGVVITHPHPLYGGDMENTVVELMTAVFRKKGFSTLRFNFRGVGASDGTYSNGPGEVRDVCSAAEFLRKNGADEIHLAGYSFGAWVNASVDCDTLSLASMAMVSPPVAFMDFGPAKPIDKLSLVVTGSADDLAPPAMLEKLVPAWNRAAAFEIVEGADHFYSERFRTLAEVLSFFIKTKDAST